LLPEINTSTLSRHVANASLATFKQDLINLVDSTLTELGVHYKECIYTPFVTLYAFLSQVLNDDSSCRRAVVEVSQIRKARKKKSCSTATGGLCRAKQRLPIELLQNLVRGIADRLAVHEKDPWRHGRVLVVDGTGFSMPDTEANGKEFVRHGANTHKKGKGKKSPVNRASVAFPVGRLVGIFSLATGCIVDLGISTWAGKGSGESSLLNSLWKCFQPNDTLLGDALFSSYRIIADARSRGAHVVSELKKSSYGRINRKKNEQIITINKAPFQKSSSASREEYDELPNSLTVRIVKLVCAPAGFRAKVKFIITTYLDSKIVSPNDLKNLYKQRWQVELNFRSIKTVLGMDILTSKSPEMIRKEVWAHMLAYNLIREQMFAVSIEKKCPVTAISFRATQQALAIVRLLSACGLKIDQSDLVEILLNEVVGKRPDRYEPRTIKRRPKGYKLMTESRNVAKAKLHKKSKT